MSARLPKTIASYEVLAELGEGGMGVLYRAQQPAIGREVVLKRMHRDLARDPGAAERFVREAQSAGQVHHQNVVVVYDCFEWRGDTFIAQEYIEGGDLAELITHAAPLPPRIAGLIALQILHGLDAVHRAGVVHRDLKPANVFVSRLGEVKIGDFGIALGASPGPALTETGHAVGTPTYMSPEQLRGERVDSRSDLFAWGAVVYEMLCGHVPFEPSQRDQDDSLLRRMEARSFTPLRRAARACPRALARVVTQCLQPKTKKRPADAAALRDRVAQALGAPSAAEAEREIAEWIAVAVTSTAAPEHTEVVSLAGDEPTPRGRGAALALAMVTLVLLGLGWVVLEATQAPWGLLRDPPAWLGEELAPEARAGEAAAVEGRPESP